MRKRIIGILRDGIPIYKYDVWSNQFKLSLIAWASTEEEACKKLGWLPEECNAVKIIPSPWDYSGIPRENRI